MNLGITSESRSESRAFTVFQTNADWTYRGTADVTSSTLVGYRGKRLANALHPCTHTKIRIIPSPGKYPSSPEYGGDRECLIGVIPFSTTRRYLCQTVTASVDYSMSKDEQLTLMKKICGSISPAVLVPNMILELPESLELWHALKAPLMAAVSLQRTSARRRLKHGANSLLSQQFGLFPLVGDIHKLLTLSSKVAHHVKRLTTFPSTWTKQRKAISSKGLTGDIYVSGGGMANAKCVERTAEASAYITYEARNAYTGSTDLLRARVASELMGLHSPMAVLYEATPFSFVADWFYPVGDYLRRLDQSQFAGSMQIRNLCTCVKANVVAKYSHSYQSGPYVPSNTVFAKSFRRWSGLPSSTEPLESLSLPSITQSILGGALALQRWA